jgi:hypothetical protein
MTSTERLIAAARALLEASENEMITRVEWDGLSEAVAAASETPVDDQSIESSTKPRVGYDNLEFWWDEHDVRVVATVIGYDDDGLMILGNPNFDDIWHVAVEDATLTDEPLNEPPADW